MTKTVEFIFDFAGPNGYLAWYPLKEIVARSGAQLVVTPVFLGGMHKLTGNAPPMIRDADVKGKVAYASREFQRFLDRHDMVRFRFPAVFPFNSILLQRILVAASDEAERLGLIDALLPAVWERGLDCGDSNAVAHELSTAGFDAQRLLEATQDPEVKQRLIDNTENAVERGAFGIPTYFVGEEMWFGKERLGQLEDFLDGGKP